jgi:crossover junction endodeoxyribonuclease RusA
MSKMRARYTEQDLQRIVQAGMRGPLSAEADAGAAKGISGCQAGAGAAGGSGSGNEKTVGGAVILPWPPKDLSPNARVHFMALSRAKKKYRMQCYLLAKAAGLRASGRVSLAIEFRPPTRRNRDDDNLVASFKAGRDGLADALGINDNLFSMLPPVIGEPIAGGAVIVRVST